MPRTGNGTYVLPASSWNPATTGTTIESSAANTTLQDLASALTQSLSKDGQTTPTGNIPMGGFKITSLADGAAATDAATYGQTLHTTGTQTLTGDLTINGSVSLSGSLTVTGPVIFSSGTISVGNLTVTSVASVASLNVTGTTNLNLLNVSSTASLGGTTNANVLNVASVASLYTLNVASTASIQNLAVVSGIVIGTASGGNKGGGSINAQAIYINGASITESSIAFSANQNGSGQAISNNSDVKVTATTELFDVGSYYDAANSRFTPLVAGKYTFTLNVTMQSTNMTTNALQYAMIWKNGAVAARNNVYTSNGSGQLTTVSVTATLDANGSTDYFEAYIHMSSGTGNMATDGTATSTWFEGYKVA